MRILCTFAGGWGHVEPLFPIARAAKGRGHVVAFAGQAAVVADLEAIGFEAIATGPPTIRSTVSPLRAPDRDHEDRVLRDTFADRLARARCADTRDLCERWRPDVLVSDEVDFGAFIAAEHLGIPRAIVSVIAAGSFVRPELVAAPLHRLRHDYGLAPDPGMSMLHRDLLLVPAPRSFRDPRCTWPSTAHAIRPGALDPGPRSPHTTAHDRSTVYVTLGTIFNIESGDLFSRVLSGVRDLPVRVAVTVGPHVDPIKLGPQPDNVSIERFIPQASLLPQCSAVVCHAGSGTVIGALAHGVPLVVLPMGADQPHNSARCTALGVGISLDVMTATSRDIAAAVTTVTTDARYRRNAEALRDEILTLPDAVHAVELLEELWARRRQE